MGSKRAVAALFAAMIAGAGLAQNVGPPVIQSESSQVSSSEFSGASGGQIDALTKHSRDLSGSFGITAGSSTGNGLRGFAATLGGSLAGERIWFFATAQRNESQWFPSRFAGAELQQNAISDGAAAKLTMQLGDRSAFIGSYDARREPGLGTANFAARVPSSFLSLHYTGIVSSNMFFDASFSQHSGSQPAFSPQQPR